MVYSTKLIEDAYRSLGLRKCRKGNCSGHRYWEDALGRKMDSPVNQRRKTVDDNTIHSISLELAAKGICGSREFKSLMRSLRTA